MLGAGVFGNDRPAQCEKCRGPIADPTGAPCYVDTLDSGEFSESASQIAAVRARGARNPVRIDNFPAEPLSP